MDILHKLAGVIQEGFNLPKLELLMFSGNSIDYCKFISNFVTSIETRVNDTRLRLNYLIQYYTGEARRSIKDCVLLEATEGYLRAKQILYHFGRPHIVAKAYIEKLNVSRLVSSDSNGLISLSRGKIPRKCRCCDGTCKYLSDCTKFKELSVDKRIEFVRLNRLCNTCLVYNHFAKNYI